MKTLLLVLVLAFGGNDSGRGGDPWAAEFAARGYYVVGLLKSQSQKILSAEELVSLEKAVVETRIELVTSLPEDPKGGIVTALTEDDPKTPGRKVIRLLKEAWQKALADKVVVNRFVFHEYLRVIGKEDSNYEVSTQIDQLSVIDVERRIDFQLLIQGRRVPLDQAVETGRPYRCHYNAKSLNRHLDVTAIEHLNDKKLEILGSLSKNIAKEVGPRVKLLRVSFFERYLRTDFTILGEPREKGYEGGLRTEDFIFNYYSGDCPPVVGYQSSSLVNIYLYLDFPGTLGKLGDQPIFGESTEVGIHPQWTPDQILKGLNQAEDKYQAACQSWRDNVRSKLGDRYVWADCGRPHEVSERSTQFAKGRRVLFESRGTVYFTVME